MKKQTGFFVSFLLILNVTLNASGENNRDSLRRYEPGRDSSLSVRKIINVRERFEPKNKHNYLDYIQNQNTSAQTGNFWIDGNGVVNGKMLVGTTTDAGYKLDVNGETVFRGVQTLGSPYPNLAFGGVVTIKSANTNSLSAYGIKFDNASTGTAHIAISSDNSHSYGVPSKALIYQAQSHAFYNGTAQLAQIASNGNVLIGTTTDNGFKLDVNGNTRSNHFRASDRFEVQKTFGIDAGFSLNDPSGGYMTLGGASSSGFTPTIKMHPDATWNYSSILSITSDAGSYPAIILDGRTSTGPLATKDVLWIGSYLSPYIKVKANGNTLIGTTTDAGYKLDVNGAVRIGSISSDPSGANGVIFYNSSTNQFKGYRNGQWKNFLMEGDASSGASNGWSLSGNANTSSSDFIGTALGNSQPLVFKTNGSEAMRITADGKIGIGVININDGNYKLYVESGIRTRKVKVDQASWADYVFDPAYKLPSLKEVEEFIIKHKHLPDVPTEKEVQQNGLDLGNNQAVLLKKIEELTLYIIEINKKVNQLSEENKELKKKLIP